jgi:hypothetical protein
MGKRELLLAAVFIAVGVVVYQVTAPPGDPSKPGFSLGRVVNEIRREIRGQRESAEETRRSVIPIAGAVTELRLGLRAATITITGEDRSDVEAEFHVRSNGFDKAEAERLVKESVLVVDEAGALLILSARFPEAGTQNATLSLKVPRQLGVRIDEKNGRFSVSGVSSVTIGSGTGETTISHVSGPVAVTQRGRVVTIENVGPLRLNASAGADVKLSGVTGDTNLTLQSAEVTATGLAGGLEIEARNSELRLEGLEKLRGNVRLNLTSGELIMTGLSTEARIDGRRTEMRVELAAAVPLAIYNDSESVEVGLGRGGLRIDAVASDGRVSLDPALQKAGLKVNAPADGAQGPGQERVEGSLNGGGPLVTIRNTRADIVLRSGSATTTDAAPSK